MYKVFLNDKIILPGMEDPSLAPSEVISLRPGCPARELKEALTRLVAVEGIRVLRIGREGEAREAWELLAYCLGHESAAGGFVLNGDDRLLMIHRNGYWDLPKGKPNAGEELQATALREVEEETGIGGLSIIGRLRPSYHVFEKLG
ncbi:MAG TPA: NUDIX domain-containing protein, partial [Bacteroidales bacterium]|nr:NUDIX domain-containing protein [Bacteroidales bacterium]